MANKRIEYLDVVKLFTIYLVILGHVVGYIDPTLEISGSLHYFIYSFHMPLFMLLCGYFVTSMNKPFLEMLSKKAKQLLLPAITCTAICCVYLYFFRTHVNFRDEIIGNSWFLKVLFVYYIFFYFLRKIKINEWLLFIVACIILFVIPKGSTLQVNLLFPYFIGGYMLRKYNVLEKYGKSSIFLFIMFLLFLVSLLYLCYNNIPEYVPVNYNTLHDCFFIILMRYLVGFSGSLFFILLISKSDIFLSGMKLYNKMALYGRYTLGIYVLQTILVVNIFPDIVEWNMQNEILLNFVVAPLISLFVLLICIIIIKLLSSSRNLDILMFGGQYSK